MGVGDEQVTQQARYEDTANPSHLASPIQDFYNDSKVLITGATGFIGKALVEKLLRSCYNLSTVYILIRTKRGLTTDQRHEKLLTSSVFDRIRLENPALLKKVVSISGDVSEPNLGLSACDKNRLLEEVEVVFHSAATVRFTEDLNDAIQLNTIGTTKVLNLCRSMKNLKALVHVSTAYSNADKYEVKEKVYCSPAVVEEVLEACKMEDKEAMKRLQGGHPNTYTMTKAMAEYIINTQAQDLPVAIVRPSIVTGAWMQPVPGWVDNVSGISGIMVEIGRGTLRSIICDESLIMDVIPVDIVVDTLITSAWHVSKQRGGPARVYNCTSGTLNPVSWYDYGRMTEKHALTTPSKYVQWYPGFQFTTNRIGHFFVELFLHFLPALIIDVLMITQGMKPLMFNIAKKFKKACKNGEFFSLHEWDFECNNMVALNKDIVDENDRAQFNVDVAQVEWDDYVRRYVMGLRKFVLKDGPETLNKARRKLHRLYWGTKIFQVIVLAILWKIVSKWIYTLLDFS